MGLNAGAVLRSGAGPGLQRLLALGAAEMAERIAALYEDEEKLASLSRTGISYVREHFTPKNSVRALDDEFHFATENSERKCG